jgi:site-specific DNA recombinase
MKSPSVKPVRCAIYTRVSTEHGLDQEFNSLDAQYDAASAYIKSQAHAGWKLVKPLSILQQEPLRSRVTALKH